MNKDLLKSSTFLYASVALVALAMRLAYGWLAYSQNFFPDLFLDSQHYAGIAKSIVAGRGSGDTAYVMSPLYPYFLTLFVGESGELAVWWARGTQMLAGIASALMVTSLAKHYSSHFGGGHIAGWGAGLVYAVYGPLIHYETAILVEVMQGFTLILALWLLVVVRSHYLSLHPEDKKRQLQIWFAGGLLIGLAAGFRPVALLIAAMTVSVLMLLDLIRHGRLNKNWFKTPRFRQTFLICFVFGMGTITTVAPFTIRNYVVAKEFVLLSAYGGMNFWIGNHKGATGLFNTPPDYGFHLDPIGVEVARKHTGKELSQREASDWWSKQAVQDMKDDPIRWLGLYIKKMFFFLHFREIPQLGNDYHWFAKRAWPLRFPLNALPIMLCALTLPLTLLLLRKETHIGTTTKNLLMPYSWLLIYIAGISLFFITGRYRTPIMPIVFVLAATHLTLIGKNLFVARTYMVSTAMIVTLLFGSVAMKKTFNQPQWLPASSMVTGLVERQRGMAAYDRGDYQEAVRWYTTSLNIKESPITRGNLANALKALGQIDKAEQTYLQSLRVAPKDYVTWYNLANLHRDYRNDYEKASEYYQKAIALNRKFAEPYLNLALLQLKMGKIAEAEKTVETAVNIIDNTEHHVKQQLIRLKMQMAVNQKKPIVLE